MSRFSDSRGQLPSESNDLSARVQELGHFGGELSKPVPFDGDSEAVCKLAQGLQVCREVRRLCEESLSAMNRDSAAHSLFEEQSVHDELRSIKAIAVEREVQALLALYPRAKDSAPLPGTLLNDAFNVLCNLPHWNDSVKRLASQLAASFEDLADYHSVPPHINEEWRRHASDRQDVLMRRAWGGTPTSIFRF